MRGDLRAEMIAFAEQERRSLCNLAAILPGVSFDQLKAFPERVIGFTPES
jgi:hypothetical protein